MKFKRHLELEQGFRLINTVPLINMVFLLLVFFMFTSNPVIQPAIKVNLPRAVTSEAAKYENIQIIISGENLIYFNGKVVAMGELKDLLQQLSLKKRSVLLKSDQKASLGKVVEIWDMCRALGISQINIATN